MRMNGRHWQLAVVALALVTAGTGCKKKPVAIATPPMPAKEAPPQVAAPKPSISFTAEPGTIERGQTAALRWSVSNATEVAITNIGTNVPATGTRTVSPTNTTSYTLTATGPGGSDTASATVSVTSPAAPKPPPPPPPPTMSFSEILSQRVKDIYFDYNLYAIRGDMSPLMQANADALKQIFQQFPSALIQVEGNCDDRGSAEYNLGLGDRRAQSSKDFLVQLGVPEAKLRTISFGKERPACTAATEDCYQKNRRVHFASGQ